MMINGMRFYLIKIIIIHRKNSIDFLFSNKPEISKSKKCGLKS